MFLIVWALLIGAAPSMAQQASISPEENLINISELNDVFPIFESAMKSKLVTIGASAKCKASAKCTANIAAYMRDVDRQLPALKAGLKAALVTDIKKEFDPKSVELLIKVYQSLVFKRLRMSLPAPPPNKMRKYPHIARPIDRTVLEIPAIQKNFNKDELALLNKVVTNTVFLKYNAYLRKVNWSQALDEKRREYGSELRNPFE